MYFTAADLIDMTLNHLELLARVLGEDADLFAARCEQAEQDARSCREASLAIQALIPKLVAARATQSEEDIERIAPGSANNDEY